MNVFVLAILFYLIYRFIGGFLIPLFRTTKTMRQQFNNLNKQPDHNGQSSTNNHQHSAASEPQNSSHSGMSKGGEYIDFEEVK